MTHYLNTIYKTYLKHTNADDCAEYIFAHPVLLSSYRWQYVEEILLSLPSEEYPVALACFNFLQRIYTVYNQNEQPYPLGSGPLESIFASCDDEELTLATACELVGKPEVYRLLSPLYISKFSRYAELILLQDQDSWKSSKKALTIALASVEAIPVEERIEEEWYDMWSRVVISYIEMTTCELMHIPDKRNLDKATLLGEQVIERANSPKQQQRVGKLLQRLGVLHLDPWFGGKSMSNYMSQFGQWQRLIYNYNFLIVGVSPNDFEMPEPLTALSVSKNYMERAVDKLEGLDQALALKALSETYLWLYELGEDPNLEKVLKTAYRAINRMEELEFFETPYTALRNIISIYDKESTKNFREENSILKQLETESVENLVKKFDLLFLFDHMAQNIRLISGENPKLALKIWQKGQEILEGNRIDEFAEQHYKIGLRLMRDFFGTDEYLKTINATTTGEICSEIIFSALDSGRSLTVIDYAALLSAAFISTKRDEEEEGLEIIEKIAGNALFYPALRPFAPVVEYMTAHLRLNTAVNKFNNGDLTGSFQSYVSSLALFSNLGYIRTSHNVLLRIEDLIRTDYPFNQEELVAYLSTVALPLEKLNDINLTLTCQSVYRVLLPRIMSGGINPEACIILFQLMKGYSLNASLQSGLRVNLLDEKEPKNLINRINELSQNKAISAALKDNYFLEGDQILMSYVGLDQPWQGNEPEVRLQNLKMSLDRYLYSKLIPKTDSTSHYLFFGETIQKLLPANTVLLNQLIGPSQNGTESFYNVMITNEDIRIVSGELQDTPSGMVEMELNGKTLRKPMMSFMIEDARLAIQEEPEVSGLSARAKEVMKEKTGFFLGGDSLKILNDFKKAGKDHLCVWPNGPLHFFPFHLLQVDGEPICSNWTVSYISSIGILSKVNDQKSDSAGIVHDVTCMGITFKDHNPYEYLNLGPLDNSVKEATTIADIFNGNLIIEKEVTEESFIAAMQSSKWLHLSTHGMLDVNAPSFHCLFLHKGVGTDGILNAYELIDYRFDNVDLLTLSACETALGRFDYSDNIRGLPATLMQCGVKTIIGTLWESEIESSELFFHTLYSKLKEGESKLSAFTSAQRKVREEYPDYRDWGCFYYTGKFD